MSRPSNPSYVVPVWAPNVNYPAGANPWSGTPTKTTHPAAGTVGITPRQGVAAQVFNRVVNDAYTVDQSTRDSLTALYNYVGQIPALNWTLGPTLTPGTSLAYNENARVWMAVGAAGAAARSTDFGASWTSVTLPGPESGTSVDISNAGTMVILNANVAATTPLYESSNGTTWNSRTPFAAYTSVRVPNVVFSETSAVWVATLLGTLNPVVWTSADRVTWTQRTTPAGFTGTAAASNTSSLAIHKASGRMVWAYNIAATGTTHYATSDDGVTWTYRTSIVVAGFFFSAVVCDQSTGRFFLQITNGTSTRLYRSDDSGVTFSLVATLGFSLSTVAAQGSLVMSSVFTAGANQPIYSLDSGATWRFAGVEGISNVFAGGGGFVAFASGGRVARSLRIGTPGSAVP